MKISKKAFSVLLLEFEDHRIRGFELILHNSHRKQIRYEHVQRLLRIQKKCSRTEASYDSKSGIIRYASLRTSRGSRTLARAMGLADEMQMAAPEVNDDENHQKAES